ncbi:hypothetical protein CK203_104919 [Vitis vinifera]|uniref:Uncharacterized protein n=1 Tax=Vitis vinifera TaxID=29760 RepID=A0A438BN01_VITVI|nr:hypothetical protein CK203_104919 [Vitis vinifera]
MARIRGGHTNPSVSSEQRPRASPPTDSSQAPCPRPYCHPNEECPLARLNRDTPHGDHLSTP